MPRPIATAAAIAVTAASTGGRRRFARCRAKRRCQRTTCHRPTVCFSARAASRIRSRRPRRGAGPSAATRERARHLPERRQLLLALRAVREMALELVPLGRVEGVQRVAGGQLVDSGFHDPSSAPSSRSSRRRVSPANILLLIVPRGTRASPRARTASSRRSRRARSPLAGRPAAGAARSARAPARTRARRRPRPSPSSRRRGPRRRAVRRGGVPRAGRGRPPAGGRASGSTCSPSRAPPGTPAAVRHTPGMPPALRPRRAGRRAAP